MREGARLETSAAKQSIGIILARGLARGKHLVFLVTTKKGQLTQEPAFVHCESSELVGKNTTEIAGIHHARIKTRISAWIHAREAAVHSGVAALVSPVEKPGSCRSVRKILTLSSFLKCPKTFAPRTRVSTESDLHHNRSRAFSAGPEEAGDTL
jgi:hypothetical protein